MGWDVTEPALTWDSQMRHSQSQPIVRMSVTDQRQFYLFGSHIKCTNFLHAIGTMLYRHWTSFTFSPLRIHRLRMTKFKDFSTFCLALFFSRNPFGGNNDFFKRNNMGFQWKPKFNVRLEQWLGEFTPHQMDTHTLKERKKEIPICIWCRHIYAFAENSISR